MDYIISAISSYPAFFICCILVTISSILISRKENQHQEPQEKKKEERYDSTVAYIERYNSLLAKHSALQKENGELRKRLNALEESNRHLLQEKTRSQIGTGSSSSQNITDVIHDGDNLYHDIQHSLKEIAEKEDELAERTEHFSKMEESLSDREAELEKQYSRLDELDKLFSDSLFSIFHSPCRSLFENSMVYKELFTSGFDSKQIAARFNEQRLSELKDMWNLKASVQMKSAHGNDIYEVSLSNCTCRDFQYNLHRQHPCKHMYKFAITLGFLSSFSQDDISRFLNLSKK